MRCGTRTIAKSAPRNVFASVQSAAGLYMAEGWQAAGMGNRVAASDSTRLGCPHFAADSIHALEAAIERLRRPEWQRRTTKGEHMNVLEQLSGKVTHDGASLEAEYRQSRGVAAARKKLDEAVAFGRQKLQEKAVLRFSDTMPDGEAEVAIRGARNGLDEAQRTASAAIAPRVRVLHAAAANHVASTLATVVAACAELERVEQMAVRCRTPNFTRLSSPEFLVDAAKLRAFRARAERLGVALEPAVE